MTKNQYEEAGPIIEKIEKARSQLNSIKWEVEKKKKYDEENSWTKHIHFSNLFLGKKETAKVRMNYQFAQFLEIDIDEDFVKYVCEYLKARIEKLEKELAEL